MSSLVTTYVKYFMSRGGQEKPRKKNLNIYRKLDSYCQSVKVFSLKGEVDMNIFSRVVGFFRDMFACVIVGVLAVLSLIATVAFIYIGIAWVLGVLVTLFFVVMGILFACLIWQLSLCHKKQPNKKVNS